MPWEPPVDLPNAQLPLLDFGLIDEGRYKPSVLRIPGELHPHTNNSTDIISTKQFISDLSLNREENGERRRDTNAYALSGFEVGSLNVPLPEVDISWDPGDERLWVGTKDFSKAFQWSVNPIKLASSYLLMGPCVNSLLRGADAEGAAQSGPVRWPPTNNGHVDIDLGGEPLKSMGFPWLFWSWSPLELVNLWFPINDAQVRPLAFLDKRHAKEGALAKWRQDIKMDLYCFHHEKFFSDFPYVVDKCVIEKSDSFVVTTEAAGDGWWYDSQLRRGDAIVFDSTQAPHASFGRPGLDGPRLSLELRCAAVVVRRDYIYLGWGVAFCLIWALSRRLDMWEKKMILREKKNE